MLDVVRHVFLGGPARHTLWWIRKNVDRDDQKTAESGGKKLKRWGDVVLDHLEA